ncbi:hypothetical protein DL769_003537 [Monosporascus sp. CRB-8-3]|nr:hypothetical protein DL769_003537 [Monosporascus sp. CRB-8-3]
MHTDTNMLSPPDVSTEYAHGSLPASSYAPNQADLAFQSCEGSMSACDHTALDGSETSIEALVCSIPSDPPSQKQGNLQSQGESRQPDDLRMALQLLGQLTSREDTPVSASLTTTDFEFRPSQLPPFRIVIEKNKMVMDTVNNMLQSAGSEDGYFLVVMCLVVSKVLSAYAAAAQALCARESDKQGRSGLPSSSSSSTLSSWSTAANEPVPGARLTMKGRDPKAVQRLLDELYQVRSSVDQLGDKMQACAKRNWMFGSESPPMNHDFPLPAFPFSATILNQLYTELRKHCSTVSLELVSELKQFWI